MQTSHSSGCDKFRKRSSSVTAATAVSVLMALYVVNSRNTLQQRKGILGEVNDNQAVGIVPYVGIGFRHKVGEKIRILSYVS
jgi:hypothetical protein